MRNMRINPMYTYIVYVLEFKSTDNKWYRYNRSQEFATQEEATLVAYNSLATTYSHVRVRKLTVVPTTVLDIINDGRKR